jgi:hypothetical protein
MQVTNLNMCNGFKFIKIENCYSSGYKTGIDRRTIRIAWYILHPYFFHFIEPDPYSVVLITCPCHILYLKHQKRKNMMAGMEIFFFTAVLRPALGLTPPMQWYTCLFSQGAGRAACKLAVTNRNTECNFDVVFETCT